MKKTLKIIGIILLVGVIVEVGKLIGGTIGNLLTVIGAVAGIAGIVQVIRQKPVSLVAQSQ